MNVNYRKCPYCPSLWIRWTSKFVEHMAGFHGVNVTLSNEMANRLFESTVECCTAGITLDDLIYELRLQWPEAVKQAREAEEYARKVNGPPHSQPSQTEPNPQGEPRG